MAENSLSWQAEIGPEYVGMPKPSTLGRGRLGWNDAIKTQLCQVEFIDENVNHAQRIGAA